jgi:hypothetical protein
MVDLDPNSRETWAVLPPDVELDWSTAGRNWPHKEPTPTYTGVGEEPEVGDVDPAASLLE